MLANGAYFETSRLLLYLRLCQQQITMCALKRNFSKNNPVQDDAQISNTVIFMRSIFYSNILIAQRLARDADLGGNVLVTESTRDSFERLQSEELDSLSRKCIGTFILFFCDLF